MLGISDDRNAAQIGNEVAKQLQAFAVQFGRHEGDARQVSSRASQTLRKSRRDRIAARSKHYRHRQVEPVNDGHGSTLRHDYVDGDLHELRCEFRKAV